MDGLDIQTAQLIIQLARDDIYQLDDNAFNGNDQDGEILSDLEFALAEQEREFMQYWTDYGGTQIDQNADRRPGGSGNAGGGGNVGNSGGVNQAVAGPSRVPHPLGGTGPIHLPNRAGSPQLRPATPINLIDIDDDDDIYVNPYDPTSAASSSKSSNARAATPILLVPIDDDVHVHEPVSAAGSSNRNHNSHDDNRHLNNPFINVDDRDDIDVPVSMMTARTATNSQLTTNNSIRATASIAGSAMPDDEVVEIPRLNSPTLEQLLSGVFALSNSSGSQAASTSITVNRARASSGSQVRQAGPSNSVPQSTNAVSAVSNPIRPVSPDDDGGYVHQAIWQIEAPRPRAVVGHQVVCVSVHSEDDEELSDDEGSCGDYAPAETNVECHFCKDACPVGTTINTSCDHRLCRGCISRLVGICIKDETTYPPQCCGNKLQTSELRFLDHSLRQRYEAKAREYETPIPIRVYCHRCGEFLDSNSSTITTGTSFMSAASIHTTRYCDVCFVRTCVSCKQASHPTRECQETPDERALKSLATQKGWQTCPRCKAVVELSAGCYHVMCRCSAQFCYLCATTWKECNCPAFDEDRLLAMAA